MDIVEEYPTMRTERTWIRSYNGRFNPSSKFPNSGMWKMKCDHRLIKTFWDIIKRLINSGQTNIFLGIASTIHPVNLRMDHDNKATIALFTTDYKNKEEVIKAFQYINNALQDESPFIGNICMIYIQQDASPFLSIVNDLCIEFKGPTLFEAQFEIPQVKNKIMPSDITKHRVDIVTNKKKYSLQNKFPNPGAWIIQCDRTFIDILWCKLTRLIESQTTEIIYGVPSTMHPENKKDCDKGFMYCYTPNYEDTTENWEIARAINNVFQYKNGIAFNVEMTYKKCKEFSLSHDENNLHFESGNLHIYNFDIPREEAETVPSMITQNKWICANNSRLENKQGYPKAGMWIIFCNRITQLDTLWRIIKRFVESQTSEVIIRGIASTFHPENVQNYKNAVVCCHNSDSDKDSEITDALNELKRIISNQCPFFSSGFEMAYKPCPIFPVVFDQNFIIPKCDAKHYDFIHIS